MASPKELVRVVAEALGMPEPAVINHDRNLAAAGVRSSSGRGRSAAKVTARDAACLLTAVLGSGQIKDSVASVTRYAATRPDAALSSKRLFAGLGMPELGRLPGQHSFVDALERLIDAVATIPSAAPAAGEAAVAVAATGELALRIEVAALTPGTVGEIRITGGRNGRTAYVLYTEATTLQPASPRSGAKTLDAAPRASPGLEQYRRISERALIRIARLLAA